MATGESTDVCSDEIFDVMCHRKGRNREAEKYCMECSDYYCVSCVKVHEDVPSLSGHKILDKCQFPSSSGQGVISIQRCGKPLPAVPTERCDRHNHYITDLYCRSHDDVGCANCMTVDHRSCKGIFYIPEFLQNCNNGNASCTKGIQKKLQSTLRTLSYHHDNIQSQKQQLLKSKAKTLSGIKNFRREINERLDELEKNSADEVESIYKALIAEIEKAAYLIQTNKTNVTSVQNKLTSPCSNLSQNFVNAKKGKMIASTAAKCTKDGTTQIKEVDTKFEADKKLSALMEEIEAFGTITQRPVGQVTRSNVSMDTFTSSQTDTGISHHTASTSHHTDTGTSCHTNTSISHHTDMGTSNHTDMGTSNHTDMGTSNHTDMGTSNHTDTGISNHTDTGTSHHTDTGTSCHTNTSISNHTDTGTSHHTDTGTSCHTNTSISHHTDMGTSNHTDMGTSNHTDTDTSHHTDTGTSCHTNTSISNHTDTGTSNHTDTSTSNQCYVITGKPPADIIVQEFREKKEYNVKVRADKHDCHIISACTLTDGTIILADYLNMKVKRLDSSTFTVTGYCKLGGKPWQVCAISDNRVAVCLKDQDIVQIISVERNKLLKPIKIKFDFACFGMAYADGCLYISDYMDSVYVCSLTGVTLRKFSKDQSGRKLFSAIRSLDVNKDSSRIYLSDYNDGLIVLDKAGKVVGKYNGPLLKGAYDCCVTPYGSVIVSGCDSQNVLEFTPNGDGGGEIIHNGEKNQAVCYIRDKQTSKIILGRESNNSIQVCFMY